METSERSIKFKFGSPLRLFLLLLITSEMVIRESFGQCPGAAVYPYNSQSQYNNPINPGFQYYQPGMRDYGDECVPPRQGSDPSAGCDASRGLFCHQSCRCGCIVAGSIYRNGKCRARVDRYCVGEVPIQCVRNAECVIPLNQCKCKRGYWPNDEGTACNFAVKVSSPNSSSVFFGIICLIYIYFR